MCITNSRQTLKIAMRVVYKPLFWTKNRVLATGYPQRCNLLESIDFWAEMGALFEEIFQCFFGFGITGRVCAFTRSTGAHYRVDYRAYP
jgi:hypothetical protein